MKTGIIIGSTRPNRLGEGVAAWVLEQSRQFHELEFEVLDLKAFELPLLNEPVPASASKGNYQHQHTRKWAEAVNACQSFVFVTPEYNHGTSAALKNAIDYLFQEWDGKPCAFVSYGAAGGIRAVEQLRQNVITVGLIAIRPQVTFNLATDFDNGILKPNERHQRTLSGLFTELHRWTLSCSYYRNQ
ncbi:MAG: NAD(P)H-dependent oxidoreductase [Chitinophagales bacterium]